MAKLHRGPTSHGGIIGAKDVAAETLNCLYAKRLDRVYLGCFDGVVRSVDEQTAELVGEYRDSETPSAPVTGLAVSPFIDDFIAVHSDGWIRIWETRDANAAVRRLQQSGDILGCAASPHLAAFVTCSGAGSLLLYDLPTRKVIRVFEESYKPDQADGHKSRVFAVRFHPTSNQEMVSGGWDNTVQIWDLRKKTSARYIAGPHICGDGLDFNPTGNKLLTCSFRRDKNVLLWDYQEGKLLSDLTQDGSKVYSGRYIHPSLILTTSCNPSTIRIVNTESGQIACMYQSDLPGMYSADARLSPAQDKSVSITIFTTAGTGFLKLKASYYLPKQNRSTFLRR